MPESNAAERSSPEAPVGTPPPEEIVWEDPPAVKGGRRSAWGARLSPLRVHPGKWANLGDHHASTASEINHARKGGIALGEFEAVMRGVKNGRGTLYVRYVGDQPVTA